MGRESRARRIVLPIVGSIIVAIAVASLAIYWEFGAATPSPPRIGARSGTFPSITILPAGATLNVTHPYDCFASMAWLNRTPSGNAVGSFTISQASIVYILTSAQGAAFQGNSTQCAQSGNTSEPSDTAGPSSYLYKSASETSGAINVSLSSSTWGWQLVLMYIGTPSNSTLTWSSAFTETWY